MPIQTPERIIRPFLLYGGLVFTIIRRAVIVGIVLLLIHLFVVTIVPVQGESMVPTLTDKTYLLVDEVTPLFQIFKRGEIVAFRYPGDEKQKFIKRIIGLPGDIVIVRGGAVFVQRPGDVTLLRLRESYLPLDLMTENEVQYLLAGNEYFVLGDNRPNSFDSRFFGPVPDTNIIGRAWVAVWPLPGFRLISHLDPILISE